MPKDQLIDNAPDERPDKSRSAADALKREKPKKGQRTPKWVLQMRLDGLDHHDRFRKRSLRCLEFIDGDQLTEDEKLVIEDRKGADYIDNQLMPMMLLMDGLERERETVVRLNPRHLDQVQAVAVYNELLDYVLDINQGTEVYYDVAWWSRGYGFGVAKVTRNPRRGQEPILIEDVDPRMFYADPKGRSRNFNKDYAYVGEDLWMGLEDACKRWPFAKKHFLAMAEQFKTPDLRGTETHDDRWTSRADAEEGLTAIPPMQEWDNRNGLRTYNGKTDEVCISIIQYRTFERVWWLVKPSGEEEELTFPPGVDPDTGSEMLAQWMLDNPGSKLEHDDKWTVRQVIFVGGVVVLEDEPAPFGGERYTYVPFWCLFDRDNLPLPAVYTQLDNQRAINKFDQKIIEVLASKRIKVDPGAWAGLQAMGYDLETIRTEAARPDSILPNGVTVEQDLQLSAVFAELARDKRQRIKETSGLVDEVRGIGSKDQSFVALQARKEQGQLALTRIFREGDAFKRELTWVLLNAMRSEYKGPKIVRVTHKDGSQGWIGVNITDQQMAERLQSQAAQTGMPLKVAGSIENLQAELEITKAPNFGNEKDLTRERLIEWAKVTPLPPAVMLLIGQALTNDNFEGARDLGQLFTQLGMGLLMPPPPPPGPGALPPGEGGDPAGAPQEAPLPPTPAAPMPATAG